MARKSTIGDFVKPLATRNQKEKSNFRRQRDIMDLIDYSFRGQYYDEGKLKKVKINADLYNGRLDPQLYDADNCYNFGGESANIQQNPIIHFPVISQVAVAMHGEFVNTPLIIAVKDTSPLRGSFESEEFKKLFNQWVEQTYLSPIREAATQSVLSQIPQEVLEQLDEEGQQQVQMQIEQQYRAMTPEEILDHMENDFQTPIEKGGQEIIDMLVRELRIKEKFDECAKFHIMTAEPIFYVGLTPQGPEFEVVTPGTLEYGGSEETEYIQEMTWAKRTRWLTIEDAIARYPEYLDKKHLDELYALVEPIWGTSITKSDDNQSTKKFMYHLSEHGELLKEEYGNINYKTREGSTNLMKIYSRLKAQYPGTPLSSFGIREAHIVWRDKMPIFKVWRWDGEEMTEHLFGENYQTTEKDYRVEKYWVDEIWEGVKLGSNTDNPVYVKVQPIEDQYKSLTNPIRERPELPYYGKATSTHRGLSKNVSPIDLAKTYQKEFDTEMASLRQDLKSNIGNVMIMLRNLKPDNLSVSDWYTNMRDLKIMEIDTTKKGVNPLDANLVRTLDMSSMRDVSARVEYMKFLLQSIYRAMYFNESRIGQVGQYAAVGNIASQQQASNIQTEPFKEAYRQVFEKAMQALLNVARYYYRKHPEQLRGVLSPTAYLELVSGISEMYKPLTLTIENKGVEMQNVQMLKAHLQHFIQNGVGPELIAEFALAKSTTDVINISKKAQAQIQEQMRQQQESMMAIEQQKTEREMMLKQMEMEFKAGINAENNQISLERAAIQADSFRSAADADADGVADSTMNKKLQIEADLIKHYDRMALEYEKLKQQKK